MTDSSTRPLKVYFVCTGVGVMNRGIESFFRESFDGLHGRMPGIHIELFKGAGPEGVDEHRLWCLPRTGFSARVLAKCIRRNTYVAEQISSVIPFIWKIISGKPDVIFFSDGNLGMRLVRYRRWIGSYRMLYSNGAPLPPPYDGTDHVQQLAPFFMEQALAAGEPATKHSMVPYGIAVPPGPPVYDMEKRREIRRRLSLPEDRPIVLSVGWISAYHKRMDYVIQEIAALPEPRPLLVMLGAMNENTPPVLELAKKLLGESGYVARSVPYESVADYYQCADVFTLASLQEGFGRVYLEALIHGLPSIVHDYPVSRYVLGDVGIFADLSQSGALTRKLEEVLRWPPSPEQMAQRRESVRRRFDWSFLAPAYAAMFRAAAGV